MRTLRLFLKHSLPFLGGMMLVYSAVVLSVGVMQVALFGVGFLIIAAGVWKLYDPILPSERRYHALRREVDRFHGLVRQLNTTALAVQHDATPANQAEFEALQAEMHASVDQMAMVAGRTDANLPAPELAASR